MDIIYLFLIFVLNIKLLSAYKFLDTDELNRLIFREFKLIKLVEDHIAEYEKKMNALKLKVLEIKNDNAKGYDSDGKYFLNPINIFSTTKRLTVDWDEIEELIFIDNFLGVVQSFKNFSHFPTESDLKSSVSGVFLLQDIYNLSTTNLVKGEINEVNFNTSLRERDCFELGLIAYKNEDYYHSIHWMNAALNNSLNLNIENKITIWEVLAESYFQIGDVDNALNFINEVLKVSNGQLSQRTKEFYEFKSIYIVQDNNTLNKFPYQIYKNFINKNSNYPKLCRDIHNENSIKTNLNCYYETNNIPFLFIAPFKKEILNIDPLLVMFHDVISDKEIASSQNIVKNRLEYSTVYHGEQKSRVVTNSRNSKHNWIYEWQKTPSEVNVQKRVDDITNLNSKSGDLFNVNNYEIGGYYIPHYDFFKGEGFIDGKFNNNGNRIATLIFYMNDVEQGGATVFPEINISVRPKKGSALFWYNLFSSGELDYRTLHAGCPVLVGSKWISTFWIREKSQDIHRPCVESSRKN